MKSHTPTYLAEPQPQPQRYVPKRRFNYGESAHYLGISKSKVQRRVLEGRLTPVYDGSQPLLLLEELDRYAAIEQPDLEPYQRRDQEAPTISPPPPPSSTTTTSNRARKKTGPARSEARRL